VLLCSSHFEARPEPELRIEPDRFLRVVAMTEAAAMAFVGPTASKAIDAGTPTNPERWKSGARLFHVYEEML
jgi:hypothetical protein